MDQIGHAAFLAGQWWACRLENPEHRLKSAAFSRAIERRVDACLREQQDCLLVVDYDPQGIMLDVVQEVLDPQCSGYGFSAKGILPFKHQLLVCQDVLVPFAGKELPVIPVPAQPPPELTRTARG